LRAALQDACAANLFKKAHLQQRKLETNTDLLSREDGMFLCVYYDSAF